MTKVEFNKSTARSTAMLLKALSRLNASISRIERLIEAQVQCSGAPLALD